MPLNRTNRVSVLCLTLGFIVSTSLFLSTTAFSQNFIVSADNLEPLWRGHLEWADLDGDQDADLIYNGFDINTTAYTRVYENVGGVLQLRETALPHIRNGGFTTGDYDKDGDKDILIAGLTNEYIDVSHLYQNNGSFDFTFTGLSFEVLLNPSMAMIDIDNDQDLDVMITGATTDLMSSRFDVYRNEGVFFTPLSDTQLPPCGQCSMDWADVNSDGFLDVVMLGFDNSYMGLTELYINQQNYTFVKDETFSVNELYNGVVKFGDYDTDGDLDVLQCGMDPIDGFSKTSVIENLGGSWVAADIPLLGAAENFPSGAGWADLNNDGLLDIVLSGRGGSQVGQQWVFEVYFNHGDKTFTDVTSEVFVPITDSAIGIIDYDSDGDLDIVATGNTVNGPVARLYVNQFSNGTVNVKPTGINIHVTLSQGETYTASAAEFINSFYDEDEGDALQQIEIMNLPEFGTLTLNGALVTSGQVIPVTDLGGLSFTPSLTDTGTTSFSFYYNDGKDNSEETSEMIFTINATPHTPSLSVIDDIEVFMPTPIPTIDFTVADVIHPVDLLTLTATSSNQSVIPTAHLQITGSGENRTLRVKPGHHLAGETTITITASDGISTVSTAFKIKISRPGNIQEGEPFTVFPNPFRSAFSLYVAGDETFDIQVTDLIGNPVLSTSASGLKHLDLSAYPAGVYVLQLVSPDNKLYRKRVVKRD